MTFQLPYYTYLEQHRSKQSALYHAIRDGITSGMLPCRTRLASSRTLAAQYGLSRGTVNLVYEMLAAEGYLSSEPGRGTFVLYEAAAHRRERGSVDGRVYPLSDWARRLEKLNGWRHEVAGQSDSAKKGDGEGERQGCENGEGEDRAIRFDLATLDLQQFPAQEWHRFLYAEARGYVQRATAAMGHPVLGDAALRGAIAAYLRRARGIDADPRQIAVVGGSLQAIALLAQLLLGDQSRAVIESPGYSGALRAFRAAGADCIEARVDGEGIVPEDWPAQLLLVTPNRQFPTGAVLPMRRRRELLQWAATQGALIIEDDYDSEFRYRGKALDPLKTLDREGRVIYIGSFSKTLLPGTRIGYAVLPDPLIEPFARAKALYEPQPSNLLEQRALAAWMLSGQYERHLRRMIRVYSRSFRQLGELLTERLSEAIAFVEGDAGLSLFGWWRLSAALYMQFRDECARQRVYWSEAVINQEGEQRYGIMLHFPHLSSEQLRAGVERMEQVWLRLQPYHVKES